MGVEVAEVLMGVEVGVRMRQPPQVQAHEGNISRALAQFHVLQHPWTFP